MELKDSTFFLVGSIPAFFRSANLRTYFSQFVEKNHFICFHYRHRPEQLREKSEKRDLNRPHTSSTDDASLLNEDDKGGIASTRCCVVAVRSEDIGQDFVKMYHKKNWSHSDGSLLPGKVHISRLNVRKDPPELTEVTSDETNLKNTSDSILWEDLSSLPELTPPSVMPQGNVGTPLSTFMSLIRTCKLPAHVIRKLQLEFPSSRSTKRYGAVKFDYKTEHHVTHAAESDVTHAEDHVIRGEDHVVTHAKGVAGGGDGGAGDSGEEGSGQGTPDQIPSDDDHDAEEWERYEAFHDDVDKQERTKERLYEEELEVVWEKGGSGLVFYTDASHWDQQDGDFDEKCSQEDDWDVDMSVYYDRGGGTKDARDMRAMELEQRLRAGELEEDTGTWRHQPGAFEKYTKGIGSKLLKRSGWTAGSGVGATNQGITEPVESDGQHPSIKRGLGYRGEKLNRFSSAPKRRKPMKSVLISTVYDEPEEIEDTVLRSAPTTSLKHRNSTQIQHQVRFLGGGVLKPDKPV